MGEPEAYFEPVQQFNDPIEIDSNRKATEWKSTSRPGPEMLSIVRFGAGDAEWIVVSLSRDGRTASIAPLNNNGSFGMRHGVPVSTLWPYYGSSRGAQEQSA